MALTLPSSATSSTTNALAADARSLNALKYEAGQNSAQAAKEAAKQFESLFMRELIKSMREATMKSGLMDGAQGDLGTDLLDQQLSVSMSGAPGGLSEAIARQLSRQMGGADTSLSVPSTLSLPGVTSRSATSTPVVTGPVPKGRDGFVQSLSATAERVAQDSGIPASFMLGQAGHETGWGKSEIKNADGSTSFNLFGIKAGKGWTGKVAEITTTEYINGKAQKVTAKFRAYDSYEDSFRDYARLINDSPRYEKAQATARTGSAVAYAAELQKAGYATDPEYAKKLSGAINSALRVQRAQA
ncbi:MAG: flagellar assembly peptidoglycan hydrolase FlgJ [Acidovorax defluvii]|jgi:flagellar protein FlgJ|uniref:flagellar assembly peptidoglycan hydrolase FlgJ n=1 Tax=Acidovorax sp. TaxID=1872122 RepID=UPI0025B898F2|nr:flagellar assembly peptidoglycan hydrolase FlgJ [Acidovorax sp.]